MDVYQVSSIFKNRTSAWYEFVFAFTKISWLNFTGLILP